MGFKIIDNDEKQVENSMIQTCNEIKVSEE